MLGSAWTKARGIASDRMALGSAIMAMAIVSGNAISFASLPLLARIYPPEAFGIFGFIISWTTILGVLFTMRFEAIVPITKTEAAAENLTRRSANRMTLWTLILAVMLTVLVALDLNLSWDDIGPTEILIGLGAALAASYFTMGRSVHQRIDRYSIIAGSTVVRSTLFVGVSLLLASSSGSVLTGGSALLFASMLSFMVPGIIFHLTSTPRFRQALVPGRALQKRRTDMSDAALRKVSLTFVLSQISFQFPLWLSMVLFGSAATGWVTMSYRLAMFPSDILCGSVALVLARKIADSINHNPDCIAADRKLLALFLFGNFGLFLLLGIAISLCAGLLLGQEWDEGSAVMGMLAAIGLSFTIQPTVIQVLSLLQREGQILAITILHVAMLLAGAGLAWIFQSPLETAAFGLMVLEIALSIGLTFYALNVVRQHDPAGEQPL